MASNVVPLRPRPQRAGHYLRVGHGCHKQLEELQDSGELPFRRLVIDAARIDAQRDLLKALQKDGKEIVLDPNVAELATIGGAAGQARNLPWAKKGGLWQPRDMMNKHTLRAMSRDIAAMAIEVGCNAVQAPSHVLSGVKDPWLPIDLEAASVLREELDYAGGRHISIDHVLSVRYADLRDPEARALIVDQLNGIEIGQLWLRIPKFGANATGAMVRQYISAVSDLSGRIGNPSIIADCAGGLPALAAYAFGSISGICHGVGEKEVFNPDPWKRPKKSGFGGRTRRIYIPRMDMYFTEAEFDSLWKLNGSRSTLVCPDLMCCGRDRQSMSGKRHVLHQRVKQVAALDAIPEPSRPNHLLHQQIEPVGQAIRAFERIRALDDMPKIRKKLAKRSAAMDRLATQLRELIDYRGMLQRSRSSQYRGSAANMATSAKE